MKFFILTFISDIDLQVNSFLGVKKLFYQTEKHMLICSCYTANKGVIKFNNISSLFLKQPLCWIYFKLKKQGSSLMENNNFFKNDVVIINKQEVSRIIYKDQPVINNKIIDGKHRRVEGTAKRNFNENKNRFTKEKDYFEVPYKEWSKNDIVRKTYPHSNGGGFKGSIILYTQSGYLKIVKSLNDEEAWKIYERLIDYFLNNGQQSIDHTPSSNHVIDKSTTTYLAPEVEAGIKMANLFGLSGNQAILSANRIVKRLHGHDCLEMTGNTHLVAEKQEVTYTPTEIGENFLGGISAIKTNLILESYGLQERYMGTKKEKKWRATEKGKKFTVLKDVGKISGGTPVLQMVWLESVVEEIKRKR